MILQKSADETSASSNNNTAPQFSVASNIRRKFFSVKIAPLIQAKLTVSTPGDKYELQADAMAAKVMAMPDSAIQTIAREPKQPHPTTPKSFERSRKAAGNGLY
ncbi:MULTISPECIES: hypothetical protein [unclassified Microcoleus]|uniref:hypothetical protein n=1 Tax=unclassified Microcoleus TaxID=2642155 RepID=UPI002FCF256D